MPFAGHAARRRLFATIGGRCSVSCVAVEILLRLGPLPLADWFLHFCGMCLGTGSEQARAAFKAIAPALPSAQQRFELERFIGGSTAVVLTTRRPADDGHRKLMVAKRAAAAARLSASCRGDGAARTTMSRCRRRARSKSHTMRWPHNVCVWVHLRPNWMCMRV